MTYTYSAYLRSSPSLPWQCLCSFEERDRVEAREGCRLLAAELLYQRAMQGEFLVDRISVVVLPGQVRPYGPNAKRRKRT